MTSTAFWTMFKEIAHLVREGFPETISFSISLLVCWEQKSFFEKLIDLGRKEWQKRRAAGIKLLDSFLRIAFVFSPFRSKDDIPHSFLTQISFMLNQLINKISNEFSSECTKCERIKLNFRTWLKRTSLRVLPMAWAVSHTKSVQRKVFHMEKIFANIFYPYFRG